MDYFAALTAFVEAAKANNFSRAAEKLAIKASTVSRHVKDLEQDLGIALFNRSTRTLHLTEGGETFYHHAQRVLAELDQAKAATSALNQQPRGLLKLNLPPAFSRHHILPVLSEFRAQYPEVRLKLTLEEGHVNLIGAGADLALRIGVLADSSLQARKLADERRWICVSAAFAEKHSAPQRPEELSSIAFILSANNADGLRLVPREGEPETSQKVPIRADLRINDLEAQLVATRLGLGAAALPDWLVADTLRSGELVQWLPDWQVQTADVPSSLWFIYPPKRTVSSKVRCFIDFMVERVGSPPYWQT